MSPPSSVASSSRQADISVPVNGSRENHDENGAQSSSSGSSRRSSVASRKGKERADDQDAQSGGIHSDGINGDTQVQGRTAASVASRDTEESDEYSGDDSEEGEEEEPTLKYSRLKGKAPEILAKDTATAIDVSPRVIAIGTQNGMVHVLSYEGAKVNSFRPHAGSITSLRLDEENDFVATASLEGRVVIHSLTSTESYAFDYKRPMRAVALEPGFSKKTTRAFVCGGMAGNLILQEKGWMGYKEKIIHSGEGPIWAIEWRGNLIAWANDLGVKIYDTTTGQRIGYIDRGANPPRAELFKCTLLWKDDQTLIIAWADYIKVARIRSRPRSQASAGLPSLTVDMTSIYQVDCMISGISPYGSSYVVLAYISPDTFDNEVVDRAEQRRKAANRPELRIIDKGEEVTADALSLTDYHKYGCGDYNLIKSKRKDEEVFFVVSPADVIVVRPRDESDHIEWLVERERYEEALTAAEGLEKLHGGVLDVKSIGLKYMQHLIEKNDFERAAALTPKVLGKDADSWEKWIYVFVQHHQLPVWSFFTIIPFIPTQTPQLGRPVYEMVFGHLLINDRQALLKTIITWPRDIYDIGTVMSAVQGELNASEDDRILLECLAELHLINRQPAKALPYFLRLRRPDVFSLIREHNLFAAVQDQALLLVEFDRERVSGEDSVADLESSGKHGAAIKLLVDHTHSIPITRVVQQLEARPQFLYMYLDSLLEKDPALCIPYSDRMVELYAAFDLDRLMPFLRTSNYYDLEKAYTISKERDYVPEMVFLLGRMGNNKQALMLIIERLGDVQRAIDFAKEQADEDLWEDLLQYSETRPDFIRALLEHVGAEINPIRLIRRIRDGLEIPGLKPALVKILQASNLQVSLLEGCQHILNGDCAALAEELQVGQTSSARGSTKTKCEICQLPAFPLGNPPPPPTLLYLCRHVVHAACALPDPDIELPTRPEAASIGYLLSTEDKRSKNAMVKSLGGKLSYTAAVRVRVGPCPVCSLRRGGGEMRSQRGVQMVPVAA